MYEGNLVHFFANKVLRGNQHVVINVYGSAGKGKSMFAAGLILGLANYMGEQLNRDPRSLFTFKNNLACINLDRVQAVMEDPKEYNLIWLDDIGVALNSRKFYKIENMDFNDILQTFRPNKNIVIVTTQYESLIDAVIRKLAHYHVEMTHKLFELHGIPLTACKVSEILVKQKSKEIWYPFLQDPHYKYVQFVNEKVPEPFMTEYDRIRKEEFTRMLKLKKEATAKAKQDKEQQPKQTVKERVMELKRDYDAGVYGDITFKELCKKEKINYGTAVNYC